MSERQAIRHAFERAAPRYDSAAGIQREIGHRLAGLMRDRAPAGPVSRLLDAGCGTGHGLQLLRERYPAAELIAADFAVSMLEAVPASAQRVCADIEKLPFADASFDALWSSLALQWCDPLRAFREFARVLAPGGCAWVATLGPATLWELREAFRAVDEAEHVLRFRPPEVWREAAANAGLNCLEVRHESPQVLGTDLRAILAHLRGIGAHHVPSAPRTPLSRAQWRQLEAAYETHRRSDGLLPASYDLILLALQRG